MQPIREHDALAIAVPRSHRVHFAAAAAASLCRPGDAHHGNPRRMRAARAALRIDFRDLAYVLLWSPSGHFSGGFDHADQSGYLSRRPRRRTEDSRAAHRSARAQSRQCGHAGLSGARHRLPRGARAASGASGADAPVAMRATQRAVTSARPTTLAAPPAPNLKYRVPLAPSLDGNTVDVQMEQAAFAENAVRFQATLSFLQRALPRPDDRDHGPVTRTERSPCLHSRSSTSPAPACPPSPCG